MSSIGANAEASSRVGNRIDVKCALPEISRSIVLTTMPEE
jgi:hypothetical protein